MPEVPYGVYRLPEMPLCTRKVTVFALNHAFSPRPMLSRSLLLLPADDDCTGCSRRLLEDVPDALGVAWGLADV